MTSHVHWTLSQQETQVSVLERLENLVQQALSGLRTVTAGPLLAVCPCHFQLDVSAVSVVLQCWGQGCNFISLENILGPGMQLAFCSNFPRADFTPQGGQSLCSSKRAFTTCALELVLEGQEVFALQVQMDSGRLQFALQVVGKRTLQIATATTMQFTTGENCLQVLWDHDRDALAVCGGLTRSKMTFRSAGQHHAIVAIVYHFSAP